MYKQVIRLLLLIIVVVPASLAVETDRHVVVIVWDGMRPDFITPEYAPHLSQLASNGVFFANHHPVYCSATQVNGTAIATGDYPEHTGVIANSMYLPSINLTNSVVADLTNVVSRGDELTGGKYIARPTVAETLQAAGKTTAISGAKYVALFHDRHPRTNAAAPPCIYEGSAMPPALFAAITNQLGTFPPTNTSGPNTLRDEWSRRALTDIAWSNGVPAYSLLWLNEPDASQHNTGPGSEQSLAAIKSCDQQLAAVLEELDRHKLRDQTDVLVVSDHGFSTIGPVVDVVNLLTNAGFSAHHKFNQPPRPGDIIVAGQGGSELFYVIKHDRTVTHRLVKFLQQQEFSGVIFSGKKLPGTFPLSAGMVDRSTDAPDIVLSFRWSSDKATNGTPGIIWWDGTPKIMGAHASLSHYDMHNTLVAAGPDFKNAFTDNLPTANTDLAPTILHLLGVKQQKPMDGRVLSEALIVKAPKVSAPTTKRLEATATNGKLVWHQYLQTSKVNQTLYLDEGNGDIHKKE